MNDDPTPTVVRPWDTSGLPPRTEDERCARHMHCAYRDDDPARCPVCHCSWWRIAHPLPSTPPTPPQTPDEHLTEHTRTDTRRRAAAARRHRKEHTP